MDHLVKSESTISVTFVVNGRLAHNLKSWVKALPTKVQKVDLSKPKQHVAIQDAIPIDIWKLIQHREMSLSRVTIRNKFCNLYQNDNRVVTTFIFGSASSNMSKTLPLKAFEHLCTQQWPEVEMYTYTKEDANYRFRNLNIHFNELAKFFVQEKKLISTS